MTWSCFSDIHLYSNFLSSNHFVPLNSPLMVALEISKLDLCSLKPHAGSPRVQVMRKTWKSQTNKLSPLCSAGSCWLATLVWKSLTQQCLCWRPCGMRIIYSGCVFTVCVCVFTVCVCSLLCVCTLNGLIAEHKFMYGHHTWTYVTSLSLSHTNTYPLGQERGQELVESRGCYVSTNTHS